MIMMILNPVLRNEACWAQNSRDIDNVGDDDDDDDQWILFSGMKHAEHILPGNVLAMFFIACCKVNYKVYTYKYCKKFF